jgi:hypothetical protein
VISPLLEYREEIGLLLLGFGLGVVFAAWRQDILEDRRWARRLRSHLRPLS